jgi:hypothetical protein
MEKECFREKKVKNRLNSHITVGARAAHAALPDCEHG